MRGPNRNHPARVRRLTTARTLSGALAAAILLTLTLAGLPAYAHTDDELDSWRLEWAIRAHSPEWSVRHWPTLEAEYVDMSRRHPCYFREECPPHVPTTRNPEVLGVFATGGVEQWRPLVATYFRPGDVDRALRIMRCESGGDPNIMHDFSNPASASGLMQHLGKYWPARSAAAGFAGASIFDPTANVATAAWLRDQPGGWGHWVCR